MPKYYVQSGTLRAVIHSRSPHRAAMWAIARAMDAVLPDDDVALFEHPRADTSFGSLSHAEEAVGTTHAHRFVALGSMIELSEIGFDHEDALKFDTFDTFREWHALVDAIDRIACML